MKAYLAVLIVLGLQLFPLPAADNKEAPKPLPPEIVQMWRDAGANVGWMDMNLHSHFSKHNFHAEGKRGKQTPDDYWWDRTSGMQVFQFPEWEEGVLVKLPDPGALFGLCLNLTKVTDAGLKELAGLKSLHALYLASNGPKTEAQISDAGLKELDGLKSLQILDVRGTKVTDTGLKELAGLKNMQELYLTGCQVTDAGLKELAGLKKLEVLHLGNTKVTGAGLKELAGLESLQALYLYDTPLTDAELKHLAALKSLRYLNLAHCSGVTDAGLKELGTLMGLKYLRLYLTKVSAAGAAALRKELPGCNVQ
jgi:internalin A